MTVGERIKRERKKKGLTQKELAEKLGVSVVSVQRYEAEDRGVKSDTLKRIADILDIDIYNLVSDTPTSFEIPMSELKEYYAPFISDVEKNFNKLNKDGRTKVVEYAADLSENPKYKK